MIYVIEGPDRVGKSTVIDRLRRSITNPKLLVIHSSRPPIGVDTYLWGIDHFNMLLQNAINLNDNGYDIILDRSWLSETVYGPLYRDTNIPIDVMEHGIDDTTNIKLLLLIDSPSNLCKREDGESDGTSVIDKQNEIDLFNRAYLLSAIKDKFIVDWTYKIFNNESIENIIEKLLK